MKPFAHVAFAVLASTAIAAAPIPQGSVTASASSSFFGALTGPTLTIDGSGLTGDLHGNDASGAGMWLSSSGGGGSAANNPAGQEGPAWLLYAFDGPYDLETVWIWNHNQANLTDRGLRNVSIFTRSSASAPWVDRGSHELVQAPGTANYGHGDEIDLNGVRAGEVLLTVAPVQGNYGSQYYGLSEVRFHGQPTPCVPPEFPIQPISAEKDDAYVQMLAPQPSGWLGSDVAKSIPLSDGRVVWLFGDTFIGDIVDGARAGGARFINNSIGIQQSASAAGGMAFHWGQGDTSFFPHQPGTPGNLYWPTMGIEYRGELFLFCYSVTSGLSLAHTTMIRVANPLDDPSQWDWEASDFGIGGDNIGFHTAIAVEEPHVYFMGFEKIAGIGRTVLARMTGDDLVGGAMAEALEFWADGGSGPQWSESPTDLVPLFAPGVTESDLQYLPDFDLYLATTYSAFAPRISLVVSRELTGPWSEPVCLYDVPEHDTISFDIVSYAARLHPELSTQPGELFLSYATNTFGSLSPLFTQEGLAVYAPQMVRIEIEGPKPEGWEIR